MLLQRYFRAVLWPVQSCLVFRACSSWGTGQLYRCTRDTLQVSGRRITQYTREEYWLLLNSWTSVRIAADLALLLLLGNMRCFVLAEEKKTQLCFGDWSSVVAHVNAGRLYVILYKQTKVILCVRLCSASRTINSGSGITHVPSETEGVKSSWEPAVGLQSSGTFS
jgi:hypothetical protein